MKNSLVFSNPFDLTGRVAIITGGGSGIGRSCATVLASAGASVLIVGRREEKLAQVQTEICSQGGRCEIFPGDLTEEDTCRAMVEACVSRLGRLDILVCSAGGRGKHGSLEAELTTENLRSTMAVDFDSVFWSIQYACPELEKHGVGSVINIASLAALRASGPIVYSAAKGAIRSMSKTLAKRLGPKHIRVNTIYPGFIVTEMTQGVLQSPELSAHYIGESPLGLLGEPEDIAYCALYLAGDAAKFVTGQDFIVDGGATTC